MKISLFLVENLNFAIIDGKKEKKIINNELRLSSNLTRNEHAIENFFFLFYKNVLYVFQ